MNANKKIVMENIELWHGDCRDMSDIKCDVIITDPPYGIKYIPRKIGKNETRIKYSNFEGRKMEGDIEPFDPMWILAFNKPTLLWGANHYADKLPVSSHWLVWDKRGKGYYGNNSFSDCELSWCSTKGVARIYLHIWNGIVRQGEESAKYGTGKLHPTQKPVALMMWCLKEMKVTNGMTVYDPYMGSGTTGIACIRMGCKFIGVEKEADYFEVARQRIENEFLQRKMNFA